MQLSIRIWGVWLAVALVSSVTLAQQAASSKPASLPAREILTLAANDQRNHEIEAIARATSPTGDVLYVLERSIGLIPAGVAEPTDGEFILWKLDAKGRVLGQTTLANVADVGAPWVSLLPLPAPQQGALVIGQFSERVGCSMFTIDGSGKLTDRIELGLASGVYGATLLPDGSGLLLAGYLGPDGRMRKVDMRGQVVWDKIYPFKQKATDQSPIADDLPPSKIETSAVMYSVAPADERGGFVVAGDHGPLNKFGMGEKSVWLRRCDASGAIISESNFPGRVPALCPVGAGEFIVLYDVGIGMEYDGRLRRVNGQLEQQLEVQLDFNTFSPYRPMIAAVHGDGGFVLAGNTLIVKAQQPPQREYRIEQFTSDAASVASVSIPILTQRIMPRTSVTSGGDQVYVAVQTKGLRLDEGKEAAVYSVPLGK